MAQAGWASVGVHRAGGRTEAAHARRRRLAWARQVGAAGRSLWRSPLTALLAFAPCPRAQ